MTTADWPLLPTCPTCGAPVSASASFCEACGGELTPTEPAPAASLPAEPFSGQTQRLGSRASQATECISCGGPVGADGYCQLCGTKAPSARDHYRQSPADWVAGVCDRGQTHPRNEDAMALWAQADHAVLVVCDGVSTSTDSDVAAQAGAEAARDLLVERLGSIETGSADAVQAALTEAAAAANAAVVANTAEDSTNAASATFAAAVVAGGSVHYANLGDSRVYLLSESERRLLSVDDSLAQAFIEGGMPREEAEAMPRAHAITKWLGRDATDIVPRVGSLAIDQPGWLVVCSDGLWNYASNPDKLTEQLTATGADDPATVAAKLVEWANGQGGRDNITVALARLHAPGDQPPPSHSLDSADAAASTTEQEHAEHG
ncbi:serine/threonine protein phosphatase PrpC [Propionicimonas paludicola]|uniref:Serine/threonine protein phosphatase PrpC n=1 Tax=Propionicimonas paludicola TaxID=185243 RepID=A0A2A9CRR9_9ACTN|nr:protein phosphatase 2C domain-containing protein [Propionicimonas paludicola]PFG16891.1 serine/threonine protein phosphatase PrpC [Propionicimonas paludicola]